MLNRFIKSSVRAFIKPPIKQMRKLTFKISDCEPFILKNIPYKVENNYITIDDNLLTRDLCEKLVYSNISLLNKIPDDFIDKTLCEKVFYNIFKQRQNCQIGINGLIYQPKPHIHNLYKKLIQHNNEFIYQIPANYLNSILKDMGSSFFTEKNLMSMNIINGDTYNKYFSHIPLYIVLDANNKKWTGCDNHWVYDDNGNIWFFTMSENIVVTNPEDFVCFYKKYSYDNDYQSYSITKVESINANAIIKVNYKCLIING